MNLPSKCTLVLFFAATALSLRAQDPVDSQVSPEVKALQQQGNREELQSRQEPTVSPEVQNLDAAGAKEDPAQWHNLEGFVQQKIKEGLRGKALGDAIRGERQRLGLTGLSTAMGKEMREYERAQERIEQIDQRLVVARARLNNNNPYSAGSAASSNSNVRSMVEKEVRNLEQEKEQLEKRSAKILEDLNGMAGH